MIRKDCIAFTPGIIGHAQCKPHISLCALNTGIETFDTASEGIAS